MRLKKLLLTSLTIMGSFCCFTAPAEALLASVKSFGMAGTAVAYPQDALAGAFNPAGHVDVDDRVDLGITWARDRGHCRIKGNLVPGTDGKYNGYRTRDFYTPDFGINKRFGEEGEWAIGLLVYNRSFSKTTYKKPFALLGRTAPGLEYVHQTISPVLAYRINECHQVGITLNYMIQRIKADGMENFDNPLRSAAPGRVTNRGYNYSQGLGITLGWQWHLHPDVTLGLTYQPETSMRRFKKYRGFLASNGRFNIPTVYSGGIAWRFMPCAVVAFDVQHYSWKQIKALHNSLLNDGRLELLGSSNGPGFGWKSQTFYRVGVEYALSDEWTVRAGFRHVNMPIRSSQTVVNQLTLETAEDFLTLGTTYQVSECAEVSAMFAYGFSKTLKGKGSIPPGSPLRGGFGGGEADLQQNKFAFGLSLGFNY